MPKREFSDEEIENRLREYFITERQYKRMTDFDRMVFLSKSSQFEKIAPKMLLQLWNEIQVAEKKRVQKERVHG